MENIEIINQIEQNKKYCSNKNKFTLKTILGDFNITLLYYDEYLLSSLKEHNDIYPPSRHITFTFTSDDNYLIEGKLFEFQSYLTFDWNNHEYLIMIEFFNPNDYYYNFNINSILK